MQLSLKSSYLQAGIIKKIVKEIVTASNPNKIILFGSYVQGTPNEESDIDLLIIKPKIKSKISEYVNIREKLKEVKLPFDIIVISPEEYEFYKREAGCVIRTAYEKGRVLYEKVSKTV